MKKTIKFILLSILIVGFSLLIPNLSYAARTVYDEDTLNSEISSADPGETISL